MNKIALALTLSSLLALACAHSRPPGSAPETSIAVHDQDGTELIGNVRLLGLNTKDKDQCTHSGSSCEVSVHEGVYLLKFYKMRGGRLGSLQRAGPSSSDRGIGCLLSRVKVMPGKPIVCKSNGGFDPCRRTRVHTMDCGEAVQQAWTAGPGEPTDIRPADMVDDDEDLPSQSGGQVAPSPAKQ